MPKDLVAQINEKILDHRNRVESKLQDWVEARDPARFREMEIEIHEMAREHADDITEAVLKDILRDPSFQAETSAAIRASGRPYRDVGRRSPTLTLLGGKKIRVSAEYFRRDLRGRRGRRRKSGKRGKKGTGLYPALMALGICFGASPAAVGEICRQVADSESVRAGRAALARRGLDLGHKPTLRLVNAFSGRAVEQRDAWLQKARESALTSGPLKGRRVVVATDGGRIRERIPRRRGRKRPSGHRGYDADWREPKLLVIYIIDDNGRIDCTYRPVYDGTLDDCDGLFEMLLGYLSALGAHEAAELIFIGDGARWIWENDRINNIVEHFGIERSKVTEVIDWCHVVGKLNQIAAVPAKWSQQKRNRWVMKASRYLAKGKLDRILEMIDVIAVGRRAKKVKSHRDYFERNVSRLQYEDFQAANIPIGSGAVESAIRRIVNIRMKNNGTFWLETNAEGMLLLRSYVKTDRYDDLVDWSLSTAVPWWRCSPNTSTPFGGDEDA